MALVDLIEYVAVYTKPVLSATNSPFVMVQLIFQTVSAMAVMYDAIRRNNQWERILLCIFPVVLFMTYAIMDVLVSGSFLSGGFHNFAGLSTYLNRSLLREVVAVLVLFPILAIVILRQGGKRWKLSLPGNLLAWANFAFCLYGTVRVWRTWKMNPGTNPWIETGESEEKFLLLFTYSIFTLCYQVIMNLTAVIWHFFFSESTLKGDLDVLVCDDQWCRRRIKHLLLSRYRVLLCSILPLTIVLYAVCVPDVVSERDILGFIFINAILLPFAGFCIWLIYRMLRPSGLPALRRLEGRWDSIAFRRDFCRAYFNPDNPPRRGYHLETADDFLIVRTALKPVLCRFSEIQSLLTDDGLKLVLKDGTVFKIPLGPGDDDLFRSGRKRYAADM